MGLTSKRHTWHVAYYATKCHERVCTLAVCIASLVVDDRCQHPEVWRSVRSTLCTCMLRHVQGALERAVGVPLWVTVANLAGILGNGPGQICDGSVFRGRGRLSSKVITLRPDGM